MERFARGFSCLPRGLGFLAGQPSLWPLALLPWLVNAVIVAGLVFAGIYFFGDIREAIWARPEGLLVVAWFLFNLVLAVALLVVVAVLYVILSGILAGPFNAKLAKATREILVGHALQPAGGFYVDVMLSIWNELAKGLYLLVLQALLLLLNLIPVLGSAAYVALGWYYTSLFLTYSFVEYAQDTESWALSFKQRRQYLKSRRFEALGFGTGLTLVLAIPVVNLFLAPPAVVGACLLYEDCERQRGLPFNRE